MRSAIASTWLSKSDAGKYAANEAAAVGGGGVQLVAEEEHGAGNGAAGDAGQARRGAGERHVAIDDIREGEAGVVTRNAEVAGQGELEACGSYGAVQGRHHRHRQGSQAAEGVDVVHRGLQGIAGIGVPAGAEIRTGRVHDDETYALGIGDRLGGVSELSQRAQVDAVSGVGTREGDASNRTTQAET